MNTLTYQQIEYLQYCVKETAFRDCKAGTQEVHNLKNRLVKMRAALESKKKFKIKLNGDMAQQFNDEEQINPCDDPSAYYYED